MESYTKYENMKSWLWRSQICTESLTIGRIEFKNARTSTETNPIENSSWREASTHQSKRTEAKISQRDNAAGLGIVDESRGSSLLEKVRSHAIQDRRVDGGGSSSITNTGRTLVEMVKGATDDQQERIDL